MFDLVADVEKYPQFLPLCEALVVRSRREREGVTVLVADMTVGYKAIRETFKSQVTLKPAELRIEVRYLDGPFKRLENLWRFEDRGLRQSVVHFDIEYEFSNRLLGMVMGVMFDQAFRRFTAAFEERAKAVYGSPAVS